MLSAGEVSGDLHGSYLIKAINQRLPETKFFGIGGNRMQQQGMELLYHINQMNIIGFIEVIKHIPFLRRTFSRLQKELSRRRPDLIILIDYPGFNLRLAKIAFTLGIPVMYYIIPQIWAWGAGRIKKMVQYVDQAAVILPFEAPMLTSAGMKAEFVGHPLLDFLKTRFSREDFFRQVNLNPDRKVLGLLPGSRLSEIHRLLPDMLKTARKIRQNHPDLQVIIGQTSNLEQSVYTPYLRQNPDFIWVRNLTYDVMCHADALLIASGTATLEAALFDTPMAIVYRTSCTTYFIARLLTQVQHIGLPNIIAGKEIVPEFIQNKFQTKIVSQYLEQVLYDAMQNQQAQQKLSTLKKKMGSPGAAPKAASIACALIKRHKSN